MVKETLEKIQGRQYVSTGELAELFMHVVNGSGSGCTEFAEVVTKEHRYLQGEAFTLFLFCIEAWAKAFKDGRYDARNEAACKLSDIMVTALKEKGF